jgi:hypothetical protein
MVFHLAPTLCEVPCCNSRRNGQDEGNENQIPTLFEQFGLHGPILHLPNRQNDSEAKSVPDSPTMARLEYNLLGVDSVLGGSQSQFVRAVMQTRVS